MTDLAARETHAAPHVVCLTCGRASGPSHRRRRWWPDDETPAGRMALWTAGIFVGVSAFVAVWVIGLIATARWIW